MNLDNIINSVSTDIYVHGHSPKVVFSSYYKNIKEMILGPATKYNLKLRDNRTCVYCGKKFNLNELVLDHMLPTKWGGVDEGRNRVVACKKCDGEKRASLPQDFISAALKYKQHHKDRIRFKNEGKHIYTSLTLHYYCTGIFKYIPDRNYCTV